MGGNQGAIDDVVRESALKQLDDLTAKANAAEAQIVSLTKAAIELNSATGNSRSFREYNNNASKAATETAKLQKAQQDLARATVLLQQAEQRLAALTNQTAISQQNLERATLRTQQANDRAAQSAAKALTPYQQLVNVHRALVEEARNAGIQFGLNSTQYIQASNQANGVGERLNTINNNLGNFSNNVGNYTNSFIRGFSSVYSIIRQAAFILPGLGISGIFLLLGKGIEAVIEKLDLFNVSLSKTEIQQKSFQDAIAGNEYKEAIKNITELRENLELAKEGFIDKDRVIDEYNDSIGKVTGNVDTLKEAEKGLNDNADKFIKATLLKAAAEIVLADASKEAAETALKNQKLQDDIADARNNRFTLSGFLSGGFNAGNSQSQNAAERIKSDQEEIAKNNAQLKKTFDNRLAVIKDFDKQQVGLLGKDKATAPGTGGGVSNVATLNNKIANLDLEQTKDAQKQIMDDTKKSYSDRLSAANIYYTAQKHILENNKNLALSDTKLSNNQQLAIVKEFTNNYLQVEQEQAKNVKDLRSDATKDEITLQKQRLSTAKSSEQAIIADQAASLDSRLQAVKDYVKTSTEAAELAAREERIDAGDNATKIKTINEKLKEDLNNIKKEETEKNAQILKQANDANLKALKDGGKQQADIEKEIVQNSLDVETQFTNQNKRQIAKNTNDSLIGLAEQYSKGLISTQDYNDKKSAIEDQSREDQDQADINGTTVRIGIINALIESGIGDRLALEKQLQAEKDKLADQEMKRDGDVANNSVKQTQKATEEKKKLAQSYTDLAFRLGSELTAFAKAAVDAQYTNQLNSIQGQKDALTDRTKIEIDAEDRSTDSAQTKADKIAVINAKAAAQQDQLDKKARKIKRDQAVADRAFAIANIIESTAQAVVAQLRIPGAGIGLAILVAAIGAAQLATVLATPIPAYEKGTDNAKGGLSIVGEAGREYVLPPHGDGFFTPDSASFMDIPKGSKVIPHHELFALMANPNKPSFTPKDRSDRRMIEAINSGNTKLVRAVRQNKAKTVVYVDTLKSSAHNNKRNIHFK